MATSLPSAGFLMSSLCQLTGGFLAPRLEGGNHLKVIINVHVLEQKDRSPLDGKIGLLPGDALCIVE